MTYTRWIVVRSIKPPDASIVHGLWQEARYGAPTAALYRVPPHVITDGLGPAALIWLARRLRQQERQRRTPCVGDEMKIP